MEMRHRERIRFLFVFTVLLAGFMIARVTPASADQSDSSACINCHTDLEEMDDYGAKAASAAAAVAG